MQHGVSHWDLEFSDLELDDSYASFFFPCVHWLEREGLIHVGQYTRTLGGIATGYVGNIAITSRGMVVLGKTVEINGKQEQLSTAVRRVSEGSVDYHRIGDAIGGAIGGLLKSLSGG